MRPAFRALIRLPGGNPVTDLSVNSRARNPARADSGNLGANQRISLCPANDPEGGPERSIVEATDRSKAPAHRVIFGLNARTGPRGRRAKPNARGAAHAAETRPQHERKSSLAAGPDGLRRRGRKRPPQSESGLELTKALADCPKLGGDLGPGGVYVCLELALGRGDFRPQSSQ